MLNIDQILCKYCSNIGVIFCTYCVNIEHSFSFKCRAHNQQNPIMVSELVSYILCVVESCFATKNNWAQNWHFAELLHPTVVVALMSLHKTKDSHLIEHTR